jgi:hypothetical protein
MIRTSGSAARGAADDLVGRHSTQIASESGVILGTAYMSPEQARSAVLQEIAEPGDARRDKVVLVLNFFEELRRLAPPR